MKNLLLTFVMLIMGSFMYAQSDIVLIYEGTPVSRDPILCRADSHETCLEVCKPADLQESVRVTIPEFNHVFLADKDYEIIEREDETEFHFNNIREIKE